MKTITAITSILTASVVIMTGMSCSKSEYRENHDLTNHIFHATFETSQVETKTYIDSNHKLLWTADDRLSIFEGDTYNQQYKYSGQTGKKDADFERVSSGTHSGNTISTNYAVYPYSETTEINDSEQLTIVLPAVQTYAPGSFGLGANTMVAVTKDKNDTALGFKNVCGYLVLKLYGQGSVKSITLTANNGEKISGAAQVTAGFNQNPSVTMLQTAEDYIMLDCGSGVALGNNPSSATEFWFCLPPVTFSKGFSIMVKSNDGGFMEKSVSASRTIKRNTFYSMTALEAEFEIPEAVDLGLSVKWATCNVGATTPEEYGDYLAWGETSPKSDYNWSTYTYCKGSGTTMTKYCKYSREGYHGFTDGKTTLELSDDAARANWGGGWRMPTEAEFQELIDNCTWTWTAQNGVNGYKVVSKKPGYAGNSIFLPAAGYRSGTSLDGAGSIGGYWSGSLYEGYSNIAWYLYFHSGDLYMGSRYDRLCGQSVRPVCPFQATGISLSKQSVEITVGETETLTATVQYENGATGSTATWSSNNTGVATVDQNGKITAIKAGTATITAKTQDGGYTATCTVTVQGSSTGGHEYVDLGLSVKWATCNVGATTPEEYGDYFAWGETSPKSAYNWSTYTYCKGSETTMTKYCNNSSYGYNGFTDGKTTLELSDDAACANWGGGWRMPTKAEFQELIDNCTWTWTTQNGVNGYKVVSKKSGYAGNSIFLPAAGYRNNTSLGSAGSSGDYWSSSLFEIYSYVAWRLYFDSGYHLMGSSSFRYVGQSVRPVCPFQATGISLSKQSVEITVGETETLTATVQYENGATGSTATWSSNNTGVATVDQNGKVTAVKEGTATITAKTQDGGYTATCTVTVQGSSTGNYENGYEYVDLGLSVKWATCNVGATSPEGYGDYFAWGETVGDPYVTGKTSGYTKSFDYWSTYKYCKGDYNTMTKYCNNSSYGYNGFTDNKTTLELSDDAARANWGGKWRMPTRAEFDELIDNCTWTWTKQNGVNGYKVLSKKPGYEGRYIFLPAAGSRFSTSLNGAGSRGCYWSSSLYESNSCGAWYLYFISGNHSMYGSDRYDGQSVRPVCPFQATGISLSKQSVEITVGETETLTATVQYENGATGSTATWSSNNTGVATVDQNGKVTAVNAGTATITAKTQDGGYTATCTVTVQGSSTGNYENGYEYVDLGLSVKWATCNVGATTPEEYGSYFAWGETSPKSDYNWSTYTYCKGSETTMTKYCNKSSYGYNGFTDGKTTLELSDDAARVNWGGNWRMPTYAEFYELLNSANCTWTWTTQNGVNGYKVVSKKSGYAGNSIFLPAAGYRGSTGLGDAGIGYYWSSLLLESNSSKAWNLNFSSGICGMNNFGRSSGRSVRPVCL